MSTETVSVFAPATIGNVGPGFDVLGLALEAPGDIVRATRSAQPGVRLGAVRSADPAIVELPPASDDNTACVAARAVLALLDAAWGVELELEKGLPVGSGLGSSGASAVAAAVAINTLAGDPLSRQALLAACVAAEKSACGAAHADNVAPALFGGFVLVRSDGSTTALRTELPLWVALVTPAQSLSTREARAAIPESLPRAEVVHNSAQLATMIHALARGDIALLEGALDDRIAEPRRAPLIPGFAAVKEAARSAGALGASISGAGPTIFALCADAAVAQRAERAMGQAFDAAGIASRGRATPVGGAGARIVDG